MITLPAAFEARMREQLGTEFDDYLASFNREVFQAVRVNELKMSREDFIKRMSGDAAGVRALGEPVDWCPTGFYLDGEMRDWSKNPDYFAGLYYLQEPSAMSPAAYLPMDEPGLRVLDMCAAPGGKSTQLASRLGGEGLLWSNDISASRAKALLKNLELAGVKNMVVSCEEPYKLADRLPAYFDRILVDAPCSGEGMFHKEPAIMKNWEKLGCQYYADIQREILPQAVRMLKPDGYMIYSTCTFSTMEDEEMIAWLLEKEPTMELVWEKRFWPHKVKGQGHFVTLLHKKVSPEDGRSVPQTERTASERVSRAQRTAFEEWARDSLYAPADYIPDAAWGDNLYQTAVPSELLEGLRVLRNGLLLGSISPAGRFEPSQALSLALKPEECINVINFAHDDERVIRYLKCETLMLDAPASDWQLICEDNLPLGWGKAVGTQLKNKYLKAWRYN